MLFQFSIFRLDLHSSTCPKCRSEITGRAHDTEQFLISAPKTNPIENLVKSKMLNKTKDCETEYLPPEGPTSSGEVQLQPPSSLAENFQSNLQEHPQVHLQVHLQVHPQVHPQVHLQSNHQEPKSGTPKALKRVTWSPSVQK